MTDAGDRLLVLVIIDGWGIREDPFGNAIAAARKPTWDRLWAESPHTILTAAGEPVGLPAGQQGNSEVGHLNIGAGRIVHQDLTRINRAIEDGSFFQNQVLRKAMTSARGFGTTLHLVGLVSPGGVHSSMEHLYALLRMARKLGVPRVYIHAITDGRDEPPRSAAGFMRELVAQLNSIRTAEVVTISGRYYAMDRDKRWDRTERAYRVIVDDKENAIVSDPVGLIEHCYQQDISDEFIPPTRIVTMPEDAAPREMKNGDSVIFFNFRPDRARQLTHALVDQDWPHFSRPNRPILAHFVTFTEYEKGLPVEVAFPDEPLKGVLAEVFSKNGWRQYHTAETEKYAHVTYFLNGGREAPFPGEDRLLVPSPKVATYDLQPEMSAPGVTDVVVQRIAERAHPFIVVNYANPDMVGHTGNFDATVKAVEVVDSMLARIVEAMQSRPGILAITADHGNAELKIDRETKKPLTAHTTSPVPFIVRGATGLKGLREGGKLGDIAPTLLRLLNLGPSSEMDGDDLAIHE